jgi:hypothetical protein
MGAQTVGELLSLPRIRLYRNQGLGQKIVREIRTCAERIAQVFAERGEPQPPATLDGPEAEAMRHDPRLLSVDFLARRVVPRWAEVEHRQIIAVLLGLEGDWQAGVWLAEQEVAERLACPRPTVQHAIQRAGEH